MISTLRLGELTATGMVVDTAAAEVDLALHQTGDPSQAQLLDLVVLHPSPMVPHLVMATSTGTAEMVTGTVAMEPVTAAEVAALVMEMFRLRQASIKHLANNLLRLS